MRSRRLAAVVALVLPGFALAGSATAAPASPDGQAPTVSELVVRPSPTVSEVVVTPCHYSGPGTTVPVQGRPFAPIASADGCWLFVGLGSEVSFSGGDGAVAVLRNEDGGFKLVRKVHVGHSPAGVDLSHDGKVLAITTLAGVTLFDVAKLEAGDPDALIAELPVESGVTALAISPNDQLMFAAEYRNPRVLAMDFTKARAGEKAVIATIDAGFDPVGMAFSADGRTLFSISEVAGARALPPACNSESGAGPQTSEGIFAVIDLLALEAEPAKAVLAVRKAGCVPVNVALSPDGAMAWVTARGEGRLEGFAVAKLTGGLLTGPPEISVKVGAAPIGVAVRADGSQIWVANSNRFSGGRGSLTEVGPDGRVLRTIPAGNFPRGVAFLPDGKTLVVAQYGSQALQFVPTDGP